MKTNLLLILFTLLTTSILGQTTSIPDSNFEQALIDLGLDSGPINGTVPTSNIDTVTVMNIDSKGITDFTGIEDFTALENFQASSNPCGSINLTQNTALTFLVMSGCQLTTIDVSQNVNLETLNIYGNQLTSIDLSNNPGLKWLGIFNNQLTGIDVSNNSALFELGCSNNSITELNLSNTSSLITLNCEDNQLTCLNLQNGNNVNTFLMAKNNPGLTCIQVDDTTWANNNWKVSWGNIDPGMYFNQYCGNPCSVNSIEPNNINQNIEVYPNPFNESINVFLEYQDQANISIYNSIGTLVFAQTYSQRLIQIDLNLAKGVYIMIIENKKGLVTKRIVRQ